MCVAYLALCVHPEYPFVLATNRDEYYTRPTQPARRWSEATKLFAGKDLESGGTWLGITLDGRFAMLTNYRDPASHHDGRSRGLIVRDYLVGEAAPEPFLAALAPKASEFNGFNLLVGDIHRLHYFSSRTGKSETLASGIHGLSNGSLNEPWPKVTRGKDRLRACLREKRSLEPEDLLPLLQDTAQAPESELPHTGVPLALEKALSPPFLYLADKRYGTRASSVILVHASGEARFLEVTYGEGRTLESRQLRFQIARS